MRDDLLDLMRGLRRRADHLGRTLLDDHRGYQNKNSDLKQTFVRLSSKAHEDDVGVTPTSTALMALATGDGIATFYADTEQPLDHVLSAIFNRLLLQHWTTASLAQNNAFTAAIVARCAGLLVETGNIEQGRLDALTRTDENSEFRREKKADGKTEVKKGDDINQEFRKFRGLNVKQICSALLNDAPASLKVQNYPASPAIGYWIVDAAEMLRVEFSENTAQAVSAWAHLEFVRQVSLTTAKHHTMMDPVAMVMAACLCRALRRVSRHSKTVRNAITISAPTDNELLAAIRRFFEAQNDAGVWEKYFPMFHYPDAGANHCWHFEVLEAVLREFPEILEDREVLARLDRSVEWLTRNRLAFQHEGALIHGWNAGGDVHALQAGEPESWPTGVAHMFLVRLRDGLSEHIYRRVLEKYRPQVEVFRKRDRKAWDGYLDCDLPLKDEHRKTVKKLIEREVLAPAEQAVLAQELQSPAPVPDQPPRLTHKFRLSKRRSALLFGPPGTSKTTLAKATAERLGWPFLELSPSDFLRGGLEGIYTQVNEVFEDLADLYGVVVLFDEMDALVQSREGGDEKAGVAPLDATQKFLTTSMLPKLQRLRKLGRVIFFMATNHQRDFDPAIKRAGRFDLLVRMGPASFTEKVEHIHIWMEGESADDIENVRSNLRDWLDDRTWQDRLGRFTHGEMDSFFHHLRGTYSEHENAWHAMQTLEKQQFRDLVEKWAKETITLADDKKAALKEFEEDAKEVKLQ